ncbi:ribonuclease P protein component [Candidatus Saccharibacteria bacterium]|nr:ribonuclease P protein component [Candidatus Saccharibacteria bacterium]
MYKNGKSIRGSKISIVYLSENRRRQSRFAVVVSKKVLKGAVGRNRIRRRVYEAVRAEMPELQEMIDVVISIYSKDVENMPHSELVGLLQEVFKEAKLYK